MWPLWSNLGNVLLVALSTEIQSLHVNIFHFGWSWGFVWVGERKLAKKEKDHNLSIFLFVFYIFISPWCGCCSNIALVFMGHVSGPFSASSLAFLWLSPLHVLWLNSLQPKQNLFTLLLWVLCQISSFYLCFLAHGCIICVVHWLFCHYMLQIGGFMFFEDVCSGDRQVKLCNSLLLQYSKRDPSHASALFPSSSTTASSYGSYLHFPIFFLTVSFHGLCMASPPHRAAVISMHLILLISSTFCRFADLLYVQDFAAELSFVRLETGLFRIPACSPRCFAWPQCSAGCRTDVHQAPAEEWYTEALVLIWHDNKTCL